MARIVEAVSHHELVRYVKAHRVRAGAGAMNEFVAALDPDNKVNKSVYESSGVILKEVSLGRADACPYAYLVLPYFLENNLELKLKSVDIEHPIYTEVNGYPRPITSLKTRPLLKT